MRQAEAAQGAPDRHAMYRQPVLIGYLQHRIIQRETSLGRHPRRDPVPQTGQLAMPAAITFGARPLTPPSGTLSKRLHRETGVACVCVRVTSECASATCTLGELQF